jgi:hypothetical protein
MTIFTCVASHVLLLEKGWGLMLSPLDMGSD